MEKNKKALPIVLASALASTPFVAAPQAYAIQDVSVDMTNDNVEETADYTIDFTLDEDLEAGDEIMVTFESGFDLEDVDESDVEIDGVDLKKVEIDTKNNEIVIAVDEDVDGGEEYTIVIEDVVNPDKEGNYDIDVEAENDDDTDYDTVKIVDDDDSSDEDFSVDMDEDEEDAKTGYTLGPIELEGELEEGEWVTVTFPDEDMLPSSMRTKDVEINGYEVDDVEIDGDEVQLQIPEDADGKKKLTIEFFKSAGIINPSADDDYTFTVEYDRDTYESEEFEITKKSGSSSNSGGDSDFTVTLSDSAAGARSSYTFGADFGKKELAANGEVIVEFPSSEMFPGIWTTTDVTINGKTAKKVYSSGNRVFITAPSNFTRDSEVKVSFSYSAWVTNPKTAGDYTLKMTVDGKTITSKPFKITGATYTPAPTPAPTTPVPVNNATATIGLTNPALNAVTGVNVAIKGVGVPLAKQRDFIELVFPAGYRVPAYITPAAVTVNGVTASYVGVRGQNVLIYPSQDIPAGSAANVVISPTANIVNPAVKNAYSISVFTSEEKGLLFARAVSVGGTPVVTPPATQPGVTIPANAARIKLNVASFTLHGKTYPLQAAPTLANGNTTVVPAQFFKEALALTTQWNNHTVAIISGTKVLRFTVGSNKAKVGGQEVTLPAAVQLKNNMPMIPIKFVADNLGYKLGWDAKTSTVFISR